jgi:glycosyltransferase involved in cell wall biosynthesis
VAPAIPVLWVIKGLGPGGAEHLLVDAARNADRERFSYRACYLLPEKDHLVTALREEGVEVTCLGMSSAADARWIGRLRSLIASERPSVVHAHLPFAAIGARLAVRSLRRRPRMISTEHNTWDRYRVPTRWANAATIGMNDRTIAVSRAVAASMKAARARDIVVIPNGIDVERVRSRALSREDARRSLGLPLEAPIVGTVGGITAKKGHRVLVEAARRVVTRIPEATFAFVGLPIDADGVRRAISDAELSERVLLCGYREDAARLMRAFDVVCLPSFHEGLPLSLLEALALGIPCVATAVGGVPEVLAEGAGILVPRADPSSLATALLEVLERPERAAELSAAARATSERYDVRETVRRTESVYLETLGAVR